MKQVAESSGVTEGFLSRLERDLTSPSVATLMTVCQVLHLDVGELLSHTEVARVSWEDAPKLIEAEPGVQERLLTPRSESRLQVIHSQFAPGASGNALDYSVNTPLHFVHVLEGELTVFLHDEDWTLRAQDSLTLDGRDLHRWQASASLGATVIWCLARTVAP
ncbi:possible transcriptional regulator [Leucobacter sp. 7(1)]|nr:possible transcriptional regulator [Leucobacter sp. 7(1)]